MSSWVFQGSMDRFDVDSYLSTEKDIYWTVTRRSHQRDVAVGDRVYIWRARGSSDQVPGIVAVARVTEPCTPKNDVAHPERLHDEHWHEPELEPGEVKAGLRVEESRLTSADGMLSRDQIARDPILGSIQIIKVRVGSNFRLTDAQAERLATLWGDPIVDVLPAGVEEFSNGSLWTRGEIHDRLGGQRQGGIATPAGKPYVILFSGPRGGDYGYEDGWDDAGFFLYTGEGQTGDMRFVRGNRAIRDHAKNGKKLLLFETTRSGKRRYMGSVAYVDHEFREIPDKDGSARRGIIFRLRPARESADDGSGHDVRQPALAFMDKRKSIASRCSAETRKRTSTRVERERSTAVKDYVLSRSQGYCEICGLPAPFVTKQGGGYLEPHHLTYADDEWLDSHDAVAAACPTCHRRIHSGKDGKDVNAAARVRIAAVEESIKAGRFCVVTACVILDGRGRVFVAERGHSKHLGLHWEFPGGKVEAGETLEACLAREMEEEFSAALMIGPRVFMVDHRYDHVDIRLCALEATVVSRELVPNEHRDVRWIRIEELLSLELAPADLTIAEAMATRGTTRARGMDRSI